MNVLPRCRERVQFIAHRAAIKRFIIAKIHVNIWCFILRKSYFASVVDECMGGIVSSLLCNCRVLYIDVMDDGVEVVLVRYSLFLLTIYS